MNIIYALIISFLAGISTLLGALVIFLPIKKNKINKFITLALAFSLAVMIGISVFDLMPDAFLKIVTVYPKTGIILVISLFLLSFLLIKLINNFLKHYENNLYKLGILSMICLILHNLPEGILTFLSSYSNISLGLKIALAITMHNIPEGIAIAVPIYYATGLRKKALTRALISGLSEPLGAIIAYVFLAKFISPLMIAFILVIVSGLMITLAIEQMLPSALKYNEKKVLLLGLISGIIFILINILTF